MAKLMKSYDERVRFGKNALESVNKYSIDVIGQEWIKVLKEIQSSRK